MTAIFGTPIAAVLLAVELLLFEWKPRSFAAGGRRQRRSRRLASAAARQPARCFRSPAISTCRGWRTLPLRRRRRRRRAATRACSPACSTRCEDLFGRLPMHWMWWPAIGGLVVGLGGLSEPRALGVGYDVIGDLLNGHLGVPDVALILAVKAIIWIVALGSGTSGGVLAPLLIMGGALGWLVGQYLPGDAGALGAGRHGGDDGRHHALAADRHPVCRRADAAISRCSAAAAGHRARPMPSPCCCSSARS